MLQLSRKKSFEREGWVFFTQKVAVDKLEAGLQTVQLGKRNFTFSEYGKMIKVWHKWISFGVVDLLMEMDNLINGS